MIRRFLAAVLLLLGVAAPALAQPTPVLKYIDQFPDGVLIHVNIAVTNSSAYPPAMFTPAANLPPCGNNANSSRTWVDIFNGATGARIYGFCALGRPVDLQRLWFATLSAQKPRLVFIVMTDRLTHHTYKSNRIAIP